MKKDILFALCLLALFLPFIFIPSFYSAYKGFNADHAFIMAFLKFGILSTLGEMLGLRIKTGNYNEQGFGVWPRAVIWGLLGVWIAIAMKTFGAGIPPVVDSLGVKGVAVAMGGAFTWQKLVGAFAISLMMNTCFAPIFMTVHKITDTHILHNGGKLSCLLKPIPFGNYLANLNWKVQWNFVFKKTIPFFWIPAHTITFILPADFQVLFAAVLGIALGVLLAIAAVKGGRITPPRQTSGKMGKLFFLVMVVSFFSCGDRNISSVDPFEIDDIHDTFGEDRIFQNIPLTATLFEQGDLSNGGSPNNAGNYIRLKDFVRTSCGTSISCCINKDYQIRIFEYDINKKFIVAGDWIKNDIWAYTYKDYELQPPTCYVKIVLSLMSGQELSPSESVLTASGFVLNVVGTTGESVKDKTPSFVKEACKKTLDRVLAWKGNSEVFTSLMTSDLHYVTATSAYPNRPAARYKGLQYVNYIAGCFHPDIFHFMGDFGFDQSDNQEDAWIAIRNDVEMWDSIRIPAVCTLGNHEYEAWETKKYISCKDVLHLFLDPLRERYPEITSYTDGNQYGYVENRKMKTRVFFLSTAEVAAFGFQKAQLQWLADALKGLPAGWHAVIGQHAINIPDRPFTEGIMVNGNIEKVMLEDFVAHKSGGRDGVSWDFTQLTNQKLVGVVAADVHVNYAAKINGVNWIVRQGYGQCRQTDIHDDRTYFYFNYAAELCYDLLVIKSTGEAKIFRIGAGGAEADLEILL